jgi:hypothetical protein
MDLAAPRTWRWMSDNCSGYFHSDDRTMSNFRQMDRDTSFRLPPSVDEIIARVGAQYGCGFTAPQIEQMFAAEKIADVISLVRRAAFTAQVAR